MIQINLNKYKRSLKKLELFLIESCISVIKFPLEGIIAKKRLTNPEIKVFSSQENVYANHGINEHYLEDIKVEIE